jgi:cell division transport system permease protein
MDLSSLIARARRGLREELRLYLVAISSLSVAFLCLGGALLALTNLSSMADQWGRTGRMTVYLAENAQASDIAQLRVVLEGLPEIDAVAHVTAEAARRQFVEQSDLGAEVSQLPADVFPASLEVTLHEGVVIQRANAISERVARFRGVAEVETYRGWFERLESLIQTGRAVAGIIALLVSLCVVAVIANTIKLAVARRKQEIEVMKLCGATDAFVRGPFLIEGVFQGAVSSLIALTVLVVGFLVMRDDLDTTLAALTGIRFAFLSPLMLVSLLVGGGLVGALGSALSLRRYLAV